MPPVLGPRSPSSARLASRAAGRGTTCSPSQSARSDSSSPSSSSSTSTRRPAEPNRSPTRQSFTASWASATEPHTVTPLPAARPSALITTRPSASAMAAWAAARVSHTTARGGRHARRLHDRLCERLRALDARGRRGGPEAGDAGVGHPVGEAGRRAAPPAPRRRGRRPAATPVRSSPRARRPPRRGASPTRPIPGFPGAAWSSVRPGDWASFHASACSRPPDPTRRTRMVPSLHGGRQRVSPALRRIDGDEVDRDGVPGGARGTARATS